MLYKLIKENGKVQNSADLVNSSQFFLKSTKNLSSYRNHLKYCFSTGEDEPEPEDALCVELTMEELNSAFRLIFSNLISNKNVLLRIFDDIRKVS